MSFTRDSGMTSVVVHNDRPAQITRPDIVTARDGVFSEAAPEELSAAEAARHGTAGPQSAREQSGKRWPPKAILTRLTKLYDKLSKPKPKPGGSRDA